jgi:hypothetical protein
LSVLPGGSLIQVWGPDILAGPWIVDLSSLPGAASED